MRIGLRWAQKHPYRSPEWQRAYNLRSTIERKNSELKHKSLEDLDNPLKRPARGYAQHALALAMVAAAHNIRTIDYYLLAATGIDASKSRRRRSRRDEAETIAGVSKQRDARSK